MPVRDDYLCLEVFVGIASGEEESSETINVIEEDTLDGIQSQLDAFEKRLLSDYSTQNVVSATDLKLPMLLIDNFSRIFRLWQKNPVLKNSIQSKVFYDIFSLMFRSLNDEPTTLDEQIKDEPDLLTGICDICEEEFEIIHNDAKKSFAEHETTETHVVALNLFNKIGTSDKIDDDLKLVITTRSLNGCNIEKQFGDKPHCKQQKVNDVLKQNSSFLKLSDEKTGDFQCYLCDVACNNQIGLINHCNSKIHKQHKSYFLRKPRAALKKQTEFNDDLIFSRENSVYCVLCQSIQHKQHRDQHIKGAYHKGWKNFARKVAKLEPPYLHKINQKSETCFCELCNMKFTLKNGIVPHCQTKNHLSLKNFADEIRCLYAK